MTALEIVIGIVLLVAALFLIVVIMLQDKAKRGLSGAIAGGSSSSYLGKNGAPQKTTKPPQNLRRLFFDWIKAPWRGNPEDDGPSDLRKIPQEVLPL